MTTEHPNDGGFLPALARFETCLATPVVPGELRHWLSAARDACDRVGERLRHEVRDRHNELLTETVRQDMALAPRIEALRASGEELLVEQHDIQGELERLCNRAARLEPDEAKLAEPVEQLTEQALAFVIEARRQDTAVTVWHMEAFNRDRGVAD